MGLPRRVFARIAARHLDALDRKRFPARPAANKGPSSMSSATPQTPAPSDPVWLRHYAKLVCLATLCLIFFGGQVKSHEAGLAVPDWPLTYGQNPITYPPSEWRGGVFHEHFHRLFAGTVAAMTVILAVWLYRRAPRPGQKELGFLAVVVVLAQAGLGGMTVLLHLPTWVSTSHAILAQTFFLLTLVIAYSLSRERERRGAAALARPEPHTRLLAGAVVLIGIVYAQLFLGALMRHTQSGLAIPDFPTTAGRIVPAFNDDTLAWVNDWRFEHQRDAAGSPLENVTLGQMAIHFAHRVGALAVTIQIAWLLMLGYGLRRQVPLLWRTVLLLGALCAVQVTLGITTILTVKHPYITSFHVMTGAALLGVSCLLALRAWPMTGASAAGAQAPNAKPVSG